MEEKARQIWDDFCGCADWEQYDRVDDYSWACFISLEVNGFVFEGDGEIVCGVDREICELHCTCPDGSIVRII